MASPKRILIVDDDENFLEIFSAKLRAEGFEADIAESGEEGMAKIRKNRPDLVLLDMRMPEASGADVVMALKEHPELKSVKVVFLSGVGSPAKHGQDVSMARAIGAAGFIEKSEDLDKTVADIKSFLE